MHMTLYIIIVVQVIVIPSISRVYWICTTEGSCIFPQGRYMGFVPYVVFDLFSVFQE